jgi:hypothetical protein
MMVRGEWGDVMVSGDDKQLLAGTY